MDTENNTDIYQMKAVDLAVCPGVKAGGSLAYLALKLAGEAGEVAEKIGKLIRNGTIPCNDNGSLISCGSTMYLSEDDKIKLAKELGDVRWYTAVLAHQLGFKLSEIDQMNLDKLYDRKKRDVIIGEGDER